MGYWATRGLRGSTLEEMINMTNEKYREHGLALIEKIPTPIKPIKLDSGTGTIKLAYFEKKGSVDYIGVVQGIPVCFDAKETTKEFFPLKNIHQHQIDYMAAYEKQQGVAFLLIAFMHKQEFYLLPFEVLNEYVEGALKGGRKSIPYSAFGRAYPIVSKSGYVVHYLEALATFLSTRDENN